MMMMGETQGIERKLCGDLGLPLYVLVLPSIVLVLMLIMGVILLRNDLDFFATDYYDPNPAQTVNRSLLNSSRIGLGLVQVAMVFKWLFSVSRSRSYLQGRLTIQGGSDRSAGGAGRNREYKGHTLGGDWNVRRSEGYLEAEIRVDLNGQRMDGDVTVASSMPKKQLKRRLLELSAVFGAIKQVEEEDVVRYKYETKVHCVSR
eukprot:963789_1